MHNRLILFLFVGLTYSYGQHAKTDEPLEWTLVFENDENGKRVQGDRQKLVQAARNGQPVRIG